MANQMAVRVSREKLYEQVWETPMRTLAEQYGISDRGLAKICTRLRIPVPGRGYWERKATDFIASLFETIDGKRDHKRIHILLIIII